MGKLQSSMPSIQKRTGEEKRIEKQIMHTIANALSGLNEIERLNEWRNESYAPSSFCASKNPEKQEEEK